MTEFIWEYGFNIYLTRETHKPLLQCRPGSKPVVTYFTLVNFSAIFLLFGIGVGLSLLAFLLELIVWNAKQHRRLIRVRPVPAPAETATREIDVAPADEAIQQMHIAGDY